MSGSDTCEGSKFKCRRFQNHVARFTGRWGGRWRRGCKGARLRWTGRAWALIHCLFSISEEVGEPGGGCKGKNYENLLL